VIEILQVTKMRDISPGQRELDVLRVFWELGEAKVRDVYGSLALLPTPATAARRELDGWFVGTIVL
jgi:hypothetical protein